MPAPPPPGDPTDFRCYHPSTRRQREPFGALDWPIEILATDGATLEWWPGYVDTHGGWRTTAVDSLAGWAVVGWREPGGPASWPPHDGTDPRNWPDHKPSLIGVRDQFLAWV